MSYQSDLSAGFRFQQIQWANSPGYVEPHSAPALRIDSLDWTVSPVGRLTRRLGSTQSSAKTRAAVASSRVSTRQTPTMTLRCSLNLCSRVVGSTSFRRRCRRFSTRLAFEVDGFYLSFTQGKSCDESEEVCVGYCVYATSYMTRLLEIQPGGLTHCGSSKV